eukprot:6214458-Pleurochrysis_carterae.AAC.15
MTNLKRRCHHRASILLTAVRAACLAHVYTREEHAVRAPPAAFVVVGRPARRRSRYAQSSEGKDMPLASRLLISMRLYITACHACCNCYADLLLSRPIISLALMQANSRR